MNRYGAAESFPRPQAAMPNLDWDDEPIELSQVRSVRSAGLSSHAADRDEADLDFPEAFARPYEEESVELEEDPAIAESWHARRWRRRAVRTAGWLSIVGVLAGVYGLVRAEPFRNEVTRFVTLGQVEQVPSVHGVISAIR